MRDPKRIHEIIVYLELVWEKNPDLRFFQVVAMIEDKLLAGRNVSAFYAEDDRVIKALEELDGE